MIISSLSNSIIKETARLKKAGERKEQGLVLIDGAREIELAVKSGWEITALFYCPALIKRVRIKSASGAGGKFFGLASQKIIEITATVFNKICYKEKPDGFLATARPRETSLSDIKLGKSPLIVILEAVEKPGNLGAILRTAYAVGADAVIINNSQTDIYNPNVIRASEGYVFREKIVKASISETVKWLKEKKIKSFAAATSGPKNYTKVNLRGPAAIVLGSEADGLSEEWLKAADELIKISMPVGMDSLNVSVATAVILFEALRQRSV